MAKLSVYVADDLLERAKQADPDLRPSQVLQSALEDRLPRTQRPYAIVNDTLLAQRAAAQEIVNRRATEAYQEGYAVGLEFATALPWRAFENFAQSGWDLAAWIRDFDDEEYDHVTASPAEHAAGDVVLDFTGAMEFAMNSVGYIPVEPESSQPMGLSAEGFVDAIRDVWVGAPVGRATATTQLGAPGQREGSPL